MFAIRGPFALFGGTLLALTLFFALSRLVSVPFETPERVIADHIGFTPQRAHTQPASKRDDKIERDLPPPTPDRPRLIVDTFGDGTVVAPVKPTRPALEGGRRGTGFGLAGVDGDVIPTVRVNPDYPQQAITRNIEGWVQVRFTVTAIGTVRDAVVVASEPRTTFDEAALKAIARWRYKPRIVNGEAVERVGVQAVIRFELEN